MDSTVSGPAMPRPRTAVESSRIEVRTIAVGRTPATGKTTSLSEYGRFRGWAYTSLHRILPIDRLGPDGTEFDRYDDHAVHVAAVEIAASEGVTTEEVVGVSRLICDIDDESHPYVRAGLRPGLGSLPVDSHYPALAERLAVPRGRVRCEASRYAAHHRRPSLQRRTTRALRTAMAHHFVNAGGAVAFAVVEGQMASLLERDGVVIDQVTEYIMLEDYGTENCAITIDFDRLAADSGGFDRPGVAPFDITVGVADAVRR